MFRQWRCRPSSRFPLWTRICWSSSSLLNWGLLKRSGQSLPGEASSTYLADTAAGVGMFPDVVLVAGESVEREGTDRTPADDAFPVGGGVGLEGCDRGEDFGTVRTAERDRRRTLLCPEMVPFHASTGTPTCWDRDSSDGLRVVFETGTGRHRYCNRTVAARPSGSRRRGSVAGGPGRMSSGSRGSLSRRRVPKHGLGAAPWRLESKCPSSSLLPEFDLPWRRSRTAVRGRPLPWGSRSSCSYGIDHAISAGYRSVGTA